MIKIKRTRNGSVQTRVKGEARDVAEELLNANVSIFETLVKKGFLPEDKLEEFIDDFAQQVKDNIKIKEGK